MNIPALTAGFEAALSVFSQIITFVQHIKGVETRLLPITSTPLCCTVVAVWPPQETYSPLVLECVLFRVTAEPIVLV